MHDFYTLKDLKVLGKRVIVRVDFNVPLDENGEVTDDFKIKKAIPTIKHLLNNGVKQIILMTHLGKPKGEIVENLKMDNVAKKLEELIEQKVVKVDDCVDIDLPDKKIILLENLRFHKEEKENDEVFAQKLARHADYYIDNAFGTAHRAHASVSAITKHIPSAAGFLFEKEVEMLELKNPRRPFVVILGAAKIGDKIEMIETLLTKVDKLILGGAIVFNFLKAKGYEIGNSLHEDEHLDTARRLLNNPKIILPKDIIVSNEIKENSKNWNVLVNEIPPNAIGLDIGPRTIEYYEEVLKDAHTIFWNGPMGMFEIKPYDKGSIELAKFLVKLDAKTIVGGGDTANAVRQFGLEKEFTHVSTGGGASIELLEEKELPAIKALEDNKQRFRI